MGWWEEASWKLPWSSHLSLHLTSRASSLFLLTPDPNSFCQYFFSLFAVSAMKLVLKFPKNLPKRIFGSKKDRSEVSRSDPSSFNSGTSSSSTSSDSSSSGLSCHKPTSKAYKSATATPTSVLPQASGEWSDISTDLHSDLPQALKLLDRGNDGVVSRTELEALLGRLGADPPTREEVSLMLSEVDCDGDGCIRVDALMSQVVGSACEPAAEPELRETFEFFDTDHDGKITAEELLAVFTDLGDKRCTLEDCRRMIADVDKNGDGFVCFEDFSRMMELQK